MSQEFTSYCLSDGVVRDVYISAESHCCGVAESMSRILWERARILRLTAGLEEGFWAEA